MTIATSDLGVLGNLAVALGIFTPDGDPDPDWLGDPGRSLSTMLANEAQREALIAFVDEALGGADRSTDPRGVVWLPIIQLVDPPLRLAVTIDESPAEGIHIGVGLAVNTVAPDSTTTIAIPLFRVWREGGPAVSNPLLLGSRGGRLRLATSVTIDAGAPTPGQARLGSIGMDIEIPTAASDPSEPVFGLSLGGFQLPGAPAPRDIRVAADGLDELDDALLDLVLSLVRSQADQVGADPVLAAIAGLLGLRSADEIPDFPIVQLVSDGPGALAAWLHGVITTTASRERWLTYLGTLIGANRVGDALVFTLGGVARLTIALAVDSGPSGNARLTPRLGVEVGDDGARVAARADLFTVDLVTGAVSALPRLGVWAVVGSPSQRVLDVTDPAVVRADSLRIGFALDAQRRLVFVLAADQVVLGAHSYPVLDLTSPDAIMDAVGNTVGDVAEQLLAGAGDALPAIRMLLGLDAPAGVSPLSIAALMSDPVAALTDHWRSLLAAGDAAVRELLLVVRDALADAGSAALSVRGSGSAVDPWRVPLIGPLALEMSFEGDVLSIGVATTTSIDSLGQRCTVLDTRFAAIIARVDLAARTGELLPSVEAAMVARERGVDPPRVALELGDGVSLVAGGVGMIMRWTPSAGLAVNVHAPDLALEAGGSTVPLALPSIGSDGLVTLPLEAWDGVEFLVGHMGGMLGGLFGDVVTALGWSAPAGSTGGLPSYKQRLSLARVVENPADAFAEWLPRLAMSDGGRYALELLADLFRGSGANRGFLVGTGHPDDPYRLDIDDALPGLAVWFPPEGLEREVIGAPAALQQWRPGMPGIGYSALAAALAAEARVSADIHDLVQGRPIATGLAALASRWTATDGRIVAPAGDVPGITIDRAGVSAGQLLAQLDLEGLLGLAPSTTVFVAIGTSAFPDAPADRLIDLTAPRLAASMFTIPPAVVGDWYVALPTRIDAKVQGSTTDGTPEQSARLGRVLDALSAIASDIAIVAVAGAGHAARLAADAQSAVTDLVTLGTPIGPIALTAITEQPTADTLRLLYRLLPAPPASGDVDADPEDDDLALGRGLIGAMMELTGSADPGADLRIATAAAPTTRAGLTYTAMFGVVNEEQVGRAITAVVASGLAARATTRASSILPDPTGVRAGLRVAIPASTTGTLDITGDAVVTLLAYDLDGGVDTDRELRVRVRIADREGWLSATPELELRMVTADVVIPPGSAGSGATRITLHDARVFDQSWEQLRVGTADGAVPVLPEVRVLLSAAVQRLRVGASGAVATAFADLLSALAITDAAGALVGDAVDQLVHDPAGLVRARMAAARSDVAAAIDDLLGPLGQSLDLTARTITVRGGGADSGRFGWHADVTAGVGTLAGEVRFGTPAAATPAGGLEFVVQLSPLTLRTSWHAPGGATRTVELWPAPNAQEIARVFAAAAPSLGVQVALELMRRADEDARPVIDTALDALGLLSGVTGDARRAVRPLAALIADPVGWMRSSGSLATGGARLQALLDALRPLMGVGGSAGEPLPLAAGVSLAAAADGAGTRLTLALDPGVWAAPVGSAARISAGLAAGITILPSGPPTLSTELFVGLNGAISGRQAVHVRLGAQGIELFLRPATGADIPLIPFAGLGALGAAAEMALPFLLDQLADAPDPVGPVVATLGDALALRSGSPRKFDITALRGWAADPVAALTSAVPSIVSTGLPVIAPLLDDLVPTGVDVTATANAVTVTIGAFSLTWQPDAGAVRLLGQDIEVPGIESLSFALGLGATGVDEITLTVGPAAIPAGGVTLRPFVTVAAGNAPTGGRRVVVGMALDDARRFGARLLLDSGQFSIVASNGLLLTGADIEDPVQVALRIVEVIADLVAAVAMAQQPVIDLLDTGIGNTEVRDLLRGVLLADTANPASLLPGVFEPGTIVQRIGRLFSNIAGADISITVDTFMFTIHKDAAGVVGIGVALTDRMPLVTGDVMLWLENDGSWIEGNEGGLDGLFVGFLRLSDMAFMPTLVVNGLGLRVGRNSGPLLDIGLTLDSIALHAYAEVTVAGARSGGVELQFSNLAVPTAGASGDNGVAQGIMRDTGPQPPQPAFSPALAIQKHGNAPLSVSLRAGDGVGPWWIAIQRGFGPLYLEQVGFGAVSPNGRLESVSLLMDGSVSLFGLTAAVDDLQITYFTSAGDFFSPSSWAVDLAGLAVSADMAGVSIAGGLLKRQGDTGIEYLGMLLGRFGVYGITIFGGYGEGIENGQKFTAFFAVGAVNGPIGGPPAFFLTGIGGGFGINRRLVVPTELSAFGDYPLIQALDIAAQPQDPMGQLRALGSYFPMERGTFWFAAGIAFNSFALVDGIAVVAVQVGDGLDVNLLGLARMALPRPQAAIVSIELALLVRFSSSEGVLWVQGQLTDNSWLLYEDVRLTGGFAFVTWFKGEHAGEFVLTLGGYHPSFHRDGYPQVPRLGIRWTIGDSIVITAGAYFALCSEAVMAGGDFEVSASLGPAWAELRFGAHGIVYFDPFHYQVSVYCRIRAGVTIDTWIFGEITISVSLGARVEVAGPEFHGSATFEVGPIELTVRFGGPDRLQLQPMAPDAFIQKYLEEADGGGAQAHAVVTSFGSLPSRGEKATADGSSERPYVVAVEFGLTFTTTVPATRVSRIGAGAGAISTHAPSRTLGVAPMLAASVAPTLTLDWRRNGATQSFPFTVTPRAFGSFPVGVWGQPQDPNDRKVPAGEMVEALNSLDLSCIASIAEGGPEIPYFQVEIGRRKPLPFARRASAATAVHQQAVEVANLVSTPPSVAAVYDTARRFLDSTATPTALAALRGDRTSPPLIGALAERLEVTEATVVPDIGAKRAPKVYDHFIDPPVAVGLLSGATAGHRVNAPVRTTVKGSARAWRTSPPTLAAVQAERSRSIAARLVVTDVPAVGKGKEGTMIAAVQVPPSAMARASSALVARPGSPARGQLAAFSDAISAGARVGDGRKPRDSRPRDGRLADARLLPGETVVLRLPNAVRDTDFDQARPRLVVDGAPTRVVILGSGGGLMADNMLGGDANRAGAGEIEISLGAERIIAVGNASPEGGDQETGLSGWHAGMQLPYVGWTTAIAPGCVVHSTLDALKMHRERTEAGWIAGAELAVGDCTVTTTFSSRVTTVVMAIDDPAAFGDPTGGRQLIMGLDGAVRAVDGAGKSVPPVLLTMENRSVMAYDVVPDGDGPVVVTVASETGWSLVGVMGSGEMDAAGAIALLSARGLDAAIRPLSTPAPGNGESRLEWRGPTRTPQERASARMLASRRPPLQEAVATPPAKRPVRKHGSRKATGRGSESHRTSRRTRKDDGGTR